MRVSQLIVTAATGALAAALAFGAVPASARPEDGDGNGRGHRAEASSSGQTVSESRGRSFERVQQQQAVPPVQAAPQVQRQQWQGRQEAQQGQARQWQGRQQQGDAQRQQWQARQQAPAQVQQQQVQRQQWQGRQQADRQQTDRRQWQQRQQSQQQGLQPWEAQQQRQQQQEARNWNDRRNGTYVDRNRSGTYSARDRNRTQDTYRDGTRYQNNQSAYRDGSRYQSNQRWDRTWRNNNRYDWQRYRQTNRFVFNLGTYYSPYNNYSYRRLGIGSVLAQLFYGQNYWIDDPWQYRLPDVYGPYRWVRYYDDALLVDIYSGEVVDVIYDFFW
jgi:hypothetical protein